MPSASNKLCEIIRKYFPDGEDIGYDNKCISFLRSRGYILTKDWRWIKPVPSHSINDEEFNCLKYLIDEWDFGGCL